MVHRTRNATGFPALIAFIATLAVMVVALPGPEPMAASQDSRLAAESDAFAALERATQVEVPERGVLPTDPQLHAFVTDAEGRPLFGAAVLYYLEAPIGFPEDQRGITDAEGRFRSEALDAGIYRVHAELDGYLHAAVQEIGMPAPVGTVLTFVLTPDRAD
jgi:hypothetical protein